jgi:hypothetical protein
MTIAGDPLNKLGRNLYRSLPISEWLDADRYAWEAACRPGLRLKPGGAASYLAQASRDDIARRYGAFLGFLQRSGRLEHRTTAASRVTPANVEAYVAELNDRVRKWTVWNCVYKLRLAAKILAPTLEFSWLAEIERDIALVADSRSKFDRLVLTGPLVEAGLALVLEAQSFARNDLTRSRGHPQRADGRPARLLSHSTEELRSP